MVAMMVLMRGGMIFGGGLALLRRAQEPESRRLTIA
jgi:hypothetical protein